MRAPRRQRMSQKPYETFDAIDKPAADKPRSLRSALITTLTVIVVLLGFIALCVLPSVRGARGAARRAQCASNLKQIAFALYNYQDEHGMLPPACTVDAYGKPLHSWRTLLLPYLGQKELYDTIDLTKPWDDPTNATAFETDVALYHCPGATSQKCQTTYLAIVAPDGCFRGSEPRSLGVITDDRSFTVMVVEVDTSRSVHWMSPLDASEQMITEAMDAKILPHQRALQAACADGSVRSISSEVKPAILRALISIAGGDDEAAREAD